MIIVLLHMFYLFGKRMYENYCAKKSQGLWMDAETEDSQCQCNEPKFEVPEESAEDDVPIVRCAEAIKFTPPAYIQRYCKVAETLADPKYKSEIRKVLTRILYVSLYVLYRLLQREYTLRILILIV